MDNNKKSMKKIGMLCIFIGILALVSGILMLMFASYGIWIIICSIILNIIGINLMIYKPQE